MMLVMSVGHICDTERLKAKALHVQGKKSSPAGVPSRRHGNTETPSFLYLNLELVSSKYDSEKSKIKLILHSNITLFSCSACTWASKTKVRIMLFFFYFHTVRFHFYERKGF